MVYNDWMLREFIILQGISFYIDCNKRIKPWTIECFVVVDVLQNKNIVFYRSKG